MRRFCFASALVLALVIVTPVMPEAGTVENVSLETARIRPTTIKLDEAITMALENGEDAIVAEERAEAIKAGGREKTALAGPQLEVGASYTEMDTNAEPNPYFLTPEKEYAYTATASQLVWAGGRIIKSFQLRHSDDKLAGVTRLAGRRGVRREITVSYFDLLFRSAVVELARDRVAQREQERMDAEDLELAGMVTMLDYRQATMNLNLERGALEAVLVERARAVVDFNIKLGRKTGIKGVYTEVLEPDALLPEGKLERAEGIEETLIVLEEALANGDLLDLRLMRQRVRSRTLEHGMAWGSRLPEVRIFGAWEKAGETQDEMDESWQAGVRVSMILLDGGARRAGQARAKSAKRSAEAEFKKAKKELAGLVKTLHIDATSLNEQIALKAEASQMAEENYIDAREQYRAGMITLTSLGDFSLASAGARFGLLELYYKEQRLLAHAKSLLR